MPLITRIGRQTILVLKQQKGNTPPPQLLDASNLGLLLQLGGLFSIILYTLFWLYMSRLLLPFAVSPEEIGITPTWILFRVFLFLYPSIGSLTALWLVIHAKRRWPSTAYRTLQLALLVGLVVFIAWGVREPGTGFIPDLAFASFNLSFVALLASFGSWWLDRSSKRLIITVIALAVWLICIGLFIWVSAAEKADTIATGRGQVVTLGRVHVFHAINVSGFELSGDGAPTQIFPCGILLGSSDGTTVVLVGLPGERLNTWRFPTDQITLQTGCSWTEG